MPLKPQIAARRALSTCEARSTPYEYPTTSEPMGAIDPREAELLAAQAQLGQQADQLEHLESEVTRHEQVIAQVREVLGAAAHEDLVDRAVLAVSKLRGAAKALRMAAVGLELAGNEQGATALRRAAAEVSL